MTLAFQLGLAYGLLAVMATAFSLLILHWHFKRPDKPKMVKIQPIFFRLIDDNWKWFIQLANGEELGPFKTEEAAKDYRAWFNR